MCLSMSQGTTPQDNQRDAKMGGLIIMFNEILYLYPPKVPSSEHML